LPRAASSDHFDVRYGSLADTLTSLRHVRFTPK
jgi:hypothetical protein